MRYFALLLTSIVIGQTLMAEDVMEITKVGDPVLRKVARELSIEEIQSPEIQTLIEKMTVTMREGQGCGLAAPQIGYDLQIIVIEDMRLGHLTEKQLQERNRVPTPFHVIINPKLHIDENADYVEFFEGCLSVPEIMSVVPRAMTVSVEGLNERGESIRINASGWYARILQHEIDHLKGILCLDRAHLRTMTTFANYDNIWKWVSIEDVKRMGRGEGVDLSCSN